METIRKSNTVNAQISQFVNDPFNLWCNECYFYEGENKWRHGSGGNVKYFTTDRLHKIYKYQQSLK